MFKVIRSNIQIAITPPRVVRFRSNFVQSSIVAKPVYYTRSWSKVKGQGHGDKVQGQSVSAVKRFKTATDSQSEFKLDTGDKIKADSNCAALGCLKLQCIRILPRF